MTPKEKVQIAQYLGIGTLLFLLIKYQDFIANTLQNMAIAAISAVVLLFVVYDHLFGQKRIWTLFEFVTAKLIGIVIQLDPILIAKIDLKSLFDRKEKIKDEGIAGTRQIQAKIRQTLEKESDNYELAGREFNSKDGIVDIQIVLNIGEHDISDLNPLYPNFEDWYNKQQEQ